jgi:hypothetical protein
LAESIARSKDFGLPGAAKRVARIGGDACGFFCPKMIATQSFFLRGQRALKERPRLRIGGGEVRLAAPRGPCAAVIAARPSGRKSPSPRPKPSSFAANFQKNKISSSVP